MYKDSWDDDRKENQPVVAEIVFESLGAKTKISLYSSFETKSQQEAVINSGIVEGWKMFFTNLNNVLK